MLTAAHGQSSPTVVAVPQPHPTTLPGTARNLLQQRACSYQEALGQHCLLLLHARTPGTSAPACAVPRFAAPHGVACAKRTTVPSRHMVPISTSCHWPAASSTSAMCRTWYGVLQQAARATAPRDFFQARKAGVKGVQGVAIVRTLRAPMQSCQQRATRAVWPCQNEIRHNQPCPKMPRAHAQTLITTLPQPRRSLQRDNQHLLLPLQKVQRQHRAVN